ncbi:MAG: peptidylprolyl isomerase, partial [Candidatus Eremiobacteraeota bacterium]|nr:peptidylprolyl isomerase [Candidatus Eremiobacteraeota bacterium]
MALIRTLAALALTLSPLLLGAGPSPATDVALKTSLGTIVVRLDATRAPLTTANFLHYVNSHAYDGAAFYRFVPRRPRGSGRVTISVIQGGLETKLGEKAVDHLPTVQLEPTTRTGLSNTDGTIAMARDVKPNTASSEFFINIGDNS